MKLTLSFVLVSMVLVAPALAQQQGGEPTRHYLAAAAATGAADMTDGEVRRVDAGAGKITLKHADIKNLDMPAMTMVFAVREKSLLDKVKPGDKVKFKAINDSGRLTVTEIEVAQ